MPGLPSIASLVLLRDSCAKLGYVPAPNSAIKNSRHCHVEAPLLSAHHRRPPLFLLTASVFAAEPIWKKAGAIAEQAGDAGRWFAGAISRRA